MLGELPCSEKIKNLEISVSEDCIIRQEKRTPKKSAYC